ncbi:MAG: sulfur reduction protein DsrE [Desulfohalobiaceae bacterium]|nr:sulfur reduction protein DsrE [Desulfohalobiaceae bacterium]
MNNTKVVSQGVPEILWNSFRFANLMLNNDDDVSIFLNGPAVRYLEGNSDTFPIKEQARIFTLSEGSLLA